MQEIESIQREWQKRKGTAQGTETVERRLKKAMGSGGSPPPEQKLKFKKESPPFAGFTGSPPAEQKPKLEPKKEEPFAKVSASPPHVPSTPNIPRPRPPPSTPASQHSGVPSTVFAIPVPIQPRQGGDIYGPPSPPRQDLPSLPPVTDPDERTGQLEIPVPSGTGLFQGKPHALGDYDGAQPTRHDDDPLDGFAVGDTEAHEQHTGVTFRPPDRGRGHAREPEQDLIESRAFRGDGGGPRPFRPSSPMHGALVEARGHQGGGGGPPERRVGGRRGRRAAGGRSPRTTRRHLTRPRLRGRGKESGPTSPHAGGGRPGGDAFIPNRLPPGRLTKERGREEEGSEEEEEGSDFRRGFDEGMQKERRRRRDEDEGEEETKVEGDKGEEKQARPSFQDMIAGFHSIIRDRPSMQVPHPVPVISGGPVVISDKGEALPVKTKPGVVIKQIVRQEVGTKKARKKKIKKAQKSSVKQARTEYNQLKKALRKRLAELKKSAYKGEAPRIKKLPSKERAAARKALRTRIKQEHDAKLKQLPTVGRKRYTDIIALINKLKKFKW